jgi:ankyrin repeat protein
MDANAFVRVVQALLTFVAALCVQGVLAPQTIDQSAPESLAAEQTAVDTALFQAIRMADMGAVKATLQRGASANARSEEGDTPLMYAAAYLTPACIKLLLDRGADPDARDKRGGTALMRSVRDLEKVRLLLEGGADVDATSDLGVRPLMLAANQAGASDVVKLLLARKADPKTADAQGITPLIYATDSGDLESVKALVAAGADVNAGRHTGLTPMLVAASGRVEVLVWLLEHKGNPNAALGDGRTPLMVAAVAGARDNVRALLDWGADVNARNGRGTPLMFAAGSDRAGADTIKLLLDHAADPTVVARRCDRCIHEPHADDGSMDLTALMLARQRGETDIVKLLIAAGAKR